MHAVRAVLLAILISHTSSVFAQPSAAEIRRRAQEQEDLEKEKQRKQTDESAARTIRMQRQVAEARRNWEKQPPLAPLRNPLLGKWQLQRANSGGQNNLFGILTNPEAVFCSGLFGDGIIDYRENVVADGVGNTVDQVQYHGDGKQVAVLGTRGVQLLVFDVEGANRVKSAPYDCILVRVGPPPTATASREAGPAGAPARAGAASAATQPRSPPGGGIANLGVNFGASIEAVRQTLTARRVSIMPGKHNGTLYGFTADGEFSDIDRRIKLVWYEFDAPEGPAAKLSGVVITYVRERAAQSAVYSERAAAVSKQYPLVEQSPTQMQASVPGTMVSLIDDGGAVYEVYRTR